MVRIFTVFAVSLILLLVIIVVVSDSNDGRMVARTSKAGKKPGVVNVALTQQHPVAVADIRTYEFGEMNPLESGSYEFKIKNEGRVALQIHKATTSSERIRAKITNKLVGPGDTITAHVDWFGETSGQFITETVTLHTNDPENRTLELTVEGSIRSLVVSEPRQLKMMRMIPGEESSGSVIVHSQKWDDLEIRDTTCSLDGVVVDIQPASEASLRKLQAVGGYLVTVKVPPQDVGPFQGKIKIEMASENGTENLEIPIFGNVLRRLSLYGDAIDSHGNVELGKVYRGQGQTTNLSIKLRDSESDATNWEYQTQPSFLKVAVVPDSLPGTFNMRIEIPKDAPAAMHLGMNPGSIIITADDPKISPLTLPVRFAVLNR